MAFIDDDDPDVKKARADFGSTGGNGGHTKPNSFTLTRLRAIEFDNSARCIVEDLIPREGLVLVWGPPKCGKTFWVFDLVAHVALGRSYDDREVEQGPVVYIAAEGEQGIKTRSVAFEYLPLTLRQVFYRLVGAYGYDKIELAYDRLGEALNRARRAGMISWSALRDDGFAPVHPYHSSSPKSSADGFIYDLRHFRLDRQQGQPRRLLIGVEAAGMLPQITRLAGPFGVVAYAAGGFDSSTAKHELAEMLSEWGSAEVLHIGDHDPSGVHLFSNLAEDVVEFADPEADIVFTRLAVTPQQIVDLGLPTAPPKGTDRRRFEGETTQAEAIPPDVLAAIVTQAIESRIDRAAFDAVLEQEREVQRMTPQEIARLVLLRARVTEF